MHSQESFEPWCARDAMAFGVMDKSTVHAGDMPSCSDSNCLMVDKDKRILSSENDCVVVADDVGWRLRKETRCNVAW